MSKRHAFVKDCPYNKCPQNFTNMILIVHRKIREVSSIFEKTMKNVYKSAMH